MHNTGSNGDRLDSFVRAEGVGLFTVPYTATAILLTVVIRSPAAPYVNHIHEFESLRRYGTVITTAGIRVKTAVRVTGGYRMRMVFLKKRDERCNGIEYKPRPRDSLRNLEQTSVIWVLSHLLYDLRGYIPYLHFSQSKDGISAKLRQKEHI